MSLAGKTNTADCENQAKLFISPVSHRKPLVDLLTGTLTTHAPWKQQFFLPQYSVVQSREVLPVSRGWHTRTHPHTHLKRASTRRPSPPPLPAIPQLERGRTNNPISIHRCCVAAPPLVPVTLAQIIVRNPISSCRISAVYHLSPFTLGWQRRRPACTPSHPGSVKLVSPCAVDSPPPPSSSRLSELYHVLPVDLLGARTRFLDERRLIGLPVGAVSGERASAPAGRPAEQTAGQTRARALPGGWGGGSAGSGCSSAQCELRQHGLTSLQRLCHPLQQSSPLICVRVTNGVNACIPSVWTNWINETFYFGETRNKKKTHTQPKFPLCFKVTLLSVCRCWLFYSATVVKVLRGL